MIEVTRATRGSLTRLAVMLGLKRRWFGLEPDFMFRKRILKTIQP